MNYNRLKYIVTLAETGNFTEAAKKLFIAQPSLSQIIKNEENNLGIIIFDRTKSPITLTDAGIEYVHWAKQILFLYENMEKRINDYADSRLNIIRIGILPEFSAFILPKPIKQFNPNCLIKIKEYSSNDLKARLENGEFDFIIGLSHPDTYKYTNIRLYNERIVLAMANGFNGNREGKLEVDLKDYEDVPFIIMEEGQFLYKVTYDLCKDAGFVPKLAAECYNLETALRLVRAGVGVSIIPDLMTKILNEIIFYNIKGLTPKSEISIVYEKNQYLNKDARKLIKLFKDQSMKYNTRS